MNKEIAECCPRFNSEPWDGKEIIWEHKKFVKDRVRSFLHIPINFGGVMVKNMALIEKAGAKPEGDLIVLSDENSLWGADIFLEVGKDVPGAEITEISGTFLTKVFEGPYKDMGKWVKEMKENVKGNGKEMKKLYFYYTTCPKCAKKYCENYVVLLAQV